MTHKNMIFGGVLGFTALVGALAPNVARACDADFNECFDDLELVSVGLVPLDGGIVMRPLSDDPVADYFSAPSLEMATTVTVTPMGGGLEVAGTLVANEDLELLVWRPAAPLEPDTAFGVAVTIDSSKLSCFDELPPLVRMWTVTTAAQPSPPLAAPALTGEASVQIHEHLDYDLLVCCDGALPEDTMFGNCGIGVGWTSGTCASKQGTGRLDVALELDEAAVAASGGQVSHSFEYDGGAVVFAPGSATAAALVGQPICGAVRATWLATDETILGPEVCFGQELQDMLGVQALDPFLGLATCTDQPYTCEVGDGWPAWDPETCKPWPDDEAPTTGGDSESGSTGDSESSGASESGASESTGSSGTSEPGPGGTSATDTAGQGTDKGGCACTATNSEGPWGFVVLLLPWLARRRTRAFAGPTRA